MGGDVFAEVDIEHSEVFALTQFQQSLVIDRLQMVSREFDQIGLIFEEAYDGEILKLSAKRDINCGQMFARNAELDEDLIGDGDSSEVDLLQIGGKVAHFVDKFIRNVVLVLQIQKV